MASQPAAGSASTTALETYKDITDPYHPLGENYIRKDRLQNVKPSEVKVLNTPHDNENSAVCIVEIRGITCAMKVACPARPAES